MIKSNTVKKLLIVLLTAVLLFSVAISVFHPNGKRVNATAIITSEEFQSEYSLGDTFVAPTAKISYKGQEYDAEVSHLKFPDGKTYKNESYVLSVPGEYSINYQVEVDNDIVSASVKFNVYANAYSVSSSNSSVYYGSINNTDASGNIIKNEENGENVTTDGVIVTLAAGDVFTYKKPINISGKTKADNIITLYSLPEILGKADARILKVRLTDAYDPQNYVDVVTYGNYGDEDEVQKLALYSGAGANGQPLTGLHFYASTNERTFTYQGQLYTLNKGIAYNSANGYPSFEYSLAGIKGYGQGMYSLSMDYAEKQLYGCKTIAPSSNGMIIDLDEPMFFDNLWSGFTTGEVYVSVWADNYVNSSFSFIVTGILEEDLSLNTFIDDVEPIIQVDLPEGDNVPSAIVGEDYRVFRANSYDAVDGAVDTFVTVYRNYYSSNPVMVNVTDGVFVPDRNGLYTILYTAVDSSGSQSQIRVDIVSKTESQLSIDFKTIDEQFLAGKKVAIATPSVSGNDGKYNLTVKVESANGTEVLTADKEGEYSFLPMYSGEYKVIYECSDYNVLVTEEYTLTVVNNPELTFISKVNLPPVLVKDVEYAFPEHVGYDISSGTPVEKLASIYYSFDGGEFMAYQTDSKLKIQASDTVCLRYSLGQDDIQEYTINVVDVGISDGKYLRSKYFYGENFTVEADESVSYASNEKDAKLTFVNKLLTSNFNLSFALLETNCEKVVFKLTDCNDFNNVLTVALSQKDASTTYMSINGGERILVSRAINEDAKLSYKDHERTLSFGGVTYQVDGFSGFSGRLAWLEIEFVNNVYSKIEIKEINGQQITSADTDNVPPIYSLVVNNDQKVVGDTLVISEFVTSDVLRFSTSYSLSVLDKNGTPCVAEDGTTMKNVTDFSKEYVIKLNAVGKYRITGNVSDGARITYITKQVEVTDSVAPVITLGNANKTAPTGKITVASYTATDDGGSVSVTVCVQRPDLRVVTVSENTFNADIKGVYTVMYYATDSAGNIAFKSYEIVVR